jgi:hypothetical protein
MIMSAMTSSTAPLSTSSSSVLSLVGWIGVRPVRMAKVESPHVTPATTSMKAASPV